MHERKNKAGAKINRSPNKSRRGASKLPRTDSGRDLACGFHAANAALERVEQGGGSVLRLWIQDSRQDERIQLLLQRAEQNGVSVVFDNKAKLDDIATGLNHQGVIAELRAFQYASLDQVKNILDKTQKTPLILVLDQVQDPHNLGACLRTAEGAGVDAVVLPKDGACLITETVRRVAAGAAERMLVVQVTNLSRCLEKLQQWGIWITGTSDTATMALYQADLTAPAAIVMGSEGKGLRPNTAKHCDQLVSIPMQGSVSSLNVSVATGVALFEAVRQRYDTGV